MAGIFDTHAHYTDERFNNELEGGAYALLSELFENGVDKIINVGTNTNNSSAVVDMASKFASMYAAVGVHPSDISYERSSEDALVCLRKLLDNRKDHKIVALGEIGLDYHWRQDNKELQKKFFQAQLDLAEEYDIPVIIHDREAHGDCFEAVIRRPKLRGVFHCYSGSPEMASELVRRGWYISFTGVITYKNAPIVRAAAKAVPIDRILVETDAPYLSPEPFRGKLNRSDYIAYSLRALAELHEVSEAQIREKTNENACKLFGIR